MRATLANLWHLHNSDTITDLGGKRFPFQFYYEIDLDRFLEWGPWMFNNHLLVFHILQVGEDPMVVSPLRHSERFCLARIVHGKKLEFEWDLSIKVIPKRAMVASSPWLRDQGKGPHLGELKKTLGNENLDSNEELIEEDCPMETGEGKKRPRSTQFSSVSSRIDWGKLLMDMSLFMILRYRLAL
ncbi:hypothetical protein Gohar_003182 [Gossypium harknessii]|uniref:DUF4283 domain-containing protein n=1 Tax=Gossypium harknessii TaxID=34285 RepID=A0A7J9HN47_9ROSI|nr:hypothetical protein [Gossypium harknessii]